MIEHTESSVKAIKYDGGVSALAQHHTTNFFMLESFRLGPYDHILQSGPEHDVLNSTDSPHKMVSVGGDVLHNKYHSCTPHCF